MIMKSGKPIEMSHDHKPDNPGEKRRIEKAGGFVEEGRVKGVLNLSRSMGDLEYKQDKHLTPDDQMITVVPEIKKESVMPGDFALLACDGIWDCLTSPEGVDFVGQWLKTSGEAPLSSCIASMFDKIIAPDIASSGI